MNSLNGNILVGQSRSVARLKYSKNYCLDCLPFKAIKGIYYEYDISLAYYCEVCEKHKSLCKNNILVTNIISF